MAPFIVDEEEEREDRDDEATDDEHNHNQPFNGQRCQYVKCSLTKEVHNRGGFNSI